MPFCIMRTQKLKSVGGVCASINHSFRKKETPNADAEKTPENWYSIGDCPQVQNQQNETQNANAEKTPENSNSQGEYEYPQNENDKEDYSVDDNQELRDKMADQAIAKFKKELPEKIRKNAVVGVELLMTFSPEWKDSPNYNPVAYLNACDKWAEQHFGGSKNVICKAHHFDETTPHTSIIIIPKDEKGKLNCRSFIGGNCYAMSQLQDSFYEEVGKQFGLDRGLRGSKAKHEDIKKFYGALQDTKQDAYDVSTQIAESLPEKGFFEGDSAYTKKVRAQVAHDLTPIVAKRLNEPSERQHTRQLNRSLARTIERTTEETRQAVTEKVTQELTSNYSADLEQAVRERTKEQADAVARAQRELRELQRANLLREQKEKEEKARKAREEKERKAKEEKAKQEQAEKERAEKEQKEREEQAKDDELQVLRKAKKFFCQLTTPDWYIKTGQEMQEKGCKNYLQLIDAREQEKRDQETAKQERQKILDKGFIGAGWELTERGTIELFTREMYGRNRATEPFFELVEKEWIDALTAGRNPKVREKYYFSSLKKQDGKVKVVGCFQETTKGQHL